MNFASMLVAKGLVPPGRPATAAGVALLGLLGALGTARTSAGGGADTVAGKTYAATLIWGLAGVVIGQRRRSLPTALVAAGAGVPVAAAVLRRTGRR